MLLFLNLITNHCRQAILDIVANLILSERILPGVPGGFVMLLVIPSRRRDKLGHFKKIAYAFSIREYTHLIGILNVILDI